MGLRAKSKSFDKFTRTELRSLFESDEYRNRKFEKPFQYWVPIIALFTGARLEEICQLYLTDIQFHESGWFFHFSEELYDTTVSTTHQKRLKTTSSERICPVHPKLLELGLLKFVDELRGDGKGRLFPDLKVEANGRVGPHAENGLSAIGENWV